MRSLWMTCLVAGVVSLQGCKCQQEEKKEAGAGGEVKTEAPATGEAPAGGEVKTESKAPEVAKAPTAAEIEKKEMTEKIKKLVKIEDLVEGKGAEATSGHPIVVHYTSGVLNGNEFDSSLARKSPFSFTLGAGQVLPVWDECIQGMKIGGKRKLTVPPELGYGNKGLGSVIPPDSTLVYTIELLEVH